jgi:hypothetical protein
MKKAGSTSRLFCRVQPYFLSAGFDSLGELGVGAIGDVLVALELVLPVGDVVLVVFVASAGAGAGVGAGAGAATGGVGAGGGVTIFSSFLQATRATASMAARRSERFIFFSFSRSSTLRTRKNARMEWPQGAPRYPVVMAF